MSRNIRVLISFNPDELKEIDDVVWQLRKQRATFIREAALKEAAKKGHTSTKIGGRGK